MKATKLLISTLKEAPTEAVISSHALLLRAGMIEKQVSGVYNYLPMGLRTLNKIKKIITEEMDASGALEILSSALQPKELWEESGRWQKYGPELMRLKDRHDREFCLGPTHEEIFTDLVRTLVKSKKNLPLCLYQIQTKYRDELRPRFGLMRGREFLMKDAYSFDVSNEGLDVSYGIMRQAYEKIFNRLSINYKIVLADTGAIGGSGSHQFMALSDVGESDILYCECGYAADCEKATSKAISINPDEELKNIEEIHTPNKKSIEEVSNYLNIDPKKFAKAVCFYDTVHNEVVTVFVRGDRDVNLIKVVNALGIAEHEIAFANDNHLLEVGLYEGFIGPINNPTKCLMDEELSLVHNFVCGANKIDYHLTNVNYGKDFTCEIGDFRISCDGDICPVCGNKLSKERGIEVGQIFKLGTKYSLPMNCTYKDIDGVDKPMVMGCYGIGVTRTMAAIVEQHHDEQGIIWPLNVAPYHCVIVPINYDDNDQKLLANKIYQNLLNNNVEVILDDRDERPGVKFKDWELIGIPYIITCGRRSNESIVEFKDRKTLNKQEITDIDCINTVIEAVKNI